jgi:aspartokinase
MIETAKHQIATLLDSSMVNFKMQDAIAAYGETLCARLFTMILEHHGIQASYVDARRCIVTDDHHGNANPKQIHDRLV